MNIAANRRETHELNKEIKQALTGVECVIVENALGQRYIGAGMAKRKSIAIYGTPGNDLGCYMTGGDIEVFGNAQDATGNTMDSGSITIHGMSGDAAGYSMRGGTILIKDNVGWRCGIHMKEFADHRPVIVIGGKAGQFLGEYMAGGTIILLGVDGEGFADFGRHCGVGMHGGCIYTLGKPAAQKLGAQVSAGMAGQEDMQRVHEYLRLYCAAFGRDFAEFEGREFYCLAPRSKRPYGSLYSKN